MKKILDIGCGKCKLNSTGDHVIGLDARDLEGVDVVWSLEKLPLPFQDNEFDMIRAIQVLEHIPGTSIYGVIKELWRITKAGGKIEIGVPYFASSLAFSTLDHVNQFAYTSFDQYTPGHRSHFLCAPVTFNVKAEIVWSAHKKLKSLNKVISACINKMPRVYQRFFCFILPSEIINFELTVIK